MSAIVAYFADRKQEIGLPSQYACRPLHEARIYCNKVVDLYYVLQYIMNINSREAVLL